MQNIYNPKNFEEKIYKYWEEKNLFKSKNNTNKKSFCIILPPPNITGNLHLGHAFQQTIMDILIRYHRMKGKNTLWQSGFDHAGIATQILIEKNLLEKKEKSKESYTINQLLKQAWKWKAEIEKTIIYQMKRLGNSIDWKHNQFTMNRKITNAVKEAFIRLYHENLIYRGKKIVNWDTKLQTAISDLEIEYKKEVSSIWYLRYQLYDNNLSSKNKSYLTIATTRPETIFGDTAIAVHPNDLRYKKLIGQYVIVPIINRRIPIISDEYVNTVKGTGCMKITPAHDFNDFKLGIKHKLPMINILSLNGKIRKTLQIFYDKNYNKNDKNNIFSCEIPSIFHNLTCLQARQSVIKECKKNNLIQDIKPYKLTISYNSRTGNITEPLLTNQWYVRTTVLAKQAIESVKNNSIKFVPKKYKNMYFSWMKNIHDWCISRQIWWGHKIPVWYDNNNKIYVGYNEKDIRKKNNLNKNIPLYQDQDVLDTWFSSSLWTFSSLGWPKNTNFLKKYHPSNVIVSGFDIIFFWIAKMIMMTMHLIKDNQKKPQIPFQIVFITGLLRDENGQKMSKSKGNIIDPLDIIDGISIEKLLKKRTNNMLQPQLKNQIEKRTKKQFPHGINSYGADTLRFTLMALASSGNRNIHWDMQRLQGYHNFCNKLWHASRFIIMNTENKNLGNKNEEKLFSLADRWILSKFHQIIKNFDLELKNYRFDKIINTLHKFVWHQFCDWYLEFTKPIISYGNKPEKCGTRFTLINILDSLLRLAHPIIPFITEEIWQKINKNTKTKNVESIMNQSFPKYEISKIDKKAINELEWIKSTITQIRFVKTSLNIPKNYPLNVIFKNTSKKIKNLIQENSKILCYVGKIKNILFFSPNENYPKSINIILQDAELLIPITKKFDTNNILKKIDIKLEKINLKISETEKILNSKNFLKKAPKNIIIKTKEKLNILLQEKLKLFKQKNIISAP